MTLTCLCANTPSQSPSTIPSSLARALALSTALPHAWDWLNRVPICCSGSPSSRPGEFHCTSYTSALNATAQQTGCGGNGDRIARHNAIRDVLYTLLPRLLPWHPSKEMPNLISSSLSPPSFLLLHPSIHPSRTLYCSKGNYEFGISRIIKSLEPYSKKVRYMCITPCSLIIFSVVSAWHRHLVLC